MVPGTMANGELAARHGSSGEDSGNTLGLVRHGRRRAVGEERALQAGNAICDSNKARLSGPCCVRRCFAARVALEITTLRPISCAVPFSGHFCCRALALDQV